nr:MAG TPA: hypothetical protein [Bacteriophage sp.]
MLTVTRIIIVFMLYLSKSNYTFRLNIISII